jgi:uncharacterized protein GlcG (DUF336 family)
VLGLVRTPDAPVFGTDVSLQKARTVVFFSRTDAATRLQALGQSTYASNAVAFFGSGAFIDGVAFSDRAIGNIARPNFPDGIAGRPPGPFSKPEGTWSPFNDGLQLDLVAGKVLDALVVTGINSCTTTSAGIDNGIQIFPGAVPIYRGSTLIGAIGISGDGVDQDDMIASLGLQRAFLARGGRFGTDPGHAPSAIRSDRLAVPGPGTLRYVQCPQSPFISSQAQNVCNF